MSPTKIAIISDLHVGRSARTRDLNPFSDSGEPSDGFLADFEKLVKSAALSAHALVVPGDISDRGHPQEFGIAATAIQHIAQCLGVPDQRIFPVPGNHDLSWPLIAALDPDSTNLGHSLRFEPVKRHEWFYGRLRTSTAGSLFDHPFISIDETDRIVVIRYNSAENDLPANKPHHGRITADHLAALAERLKQVDLGPDRFKVFVTHHHPVLYSDPRPELPDFSALLNAENLLNVLADHKVDIVVHGHKHVPKFRNAIDEGRHPLAILCAGSFSRELDTAWAGMITNQFHVVSFEGRNSNTMGACGIVASWAYRPGGWIPSEESWSGMRHRRPFGAFITEAQLTGTFYDQLKAKLTAARKLEWSDVEALQPYARYLDSELLERVLKRFETDTNSIMRFDPSRPEGLLMVLT